jgi:hypothetical protein
MHKITINIDAVFQFNLNFYVVFQPWIYQTASTPHKYQQLEYSNDLFSGISNYTLIANFPLRRLSV